MAEEKKAEEVVEKAEEKKEETKKETKKAAPSSKGVENVLDLVKKMTVMELADLVKSLEDEFGVTAAAPVVAAAPGIAAGGAPAAAVEEEKTDFDVVLASF